jgi:hypothetical protein
VKEYKGRIKKPAAIGTTLTAAGESETLKFSLSLTPYIVFCQLCMPISARSLLINAVEQYAQVFNHFGKALYVVAGRCFRYRPTFSNEIPERIRHWKCGP